MEGNTRSSHVRTSIPRSCQSRNYIPSTSVALAGGTGAREAASGRNRSRGAQYEQACPLNHRPIETFAASPIDAFLARFSSRILARTGNWMRPRARGLSWRRESGWMAAESGDPEDTRRSRLGRAILNHRHRRRRRRDPRETLDEMPFEGVSSSFFGITCWYRAVTPVTVLYGVAR